MYPYNNYGINPFMSQTYQARLDTMVPGATGQLPHYDIVHVNGRAGAEALPMDLNSRVIAMDDSAPLVWLITNDNGMKKATPLNITECTETPPTIGDLENRIKKLEEIVNATKSNNTTAQPNGSPAVAVQPNSDQSVYG